MRRVKERRSLYSGAIIRGVQEGRSPSFKIFPLSFEGEGDTGGEVDKVVKEEQWTFLTE